MTRTVTIEETKYYIAAQDGPLDNQVFDTYEEAAAARERLKEFGSMVYNSTMVSCHTKTIKLPDIVK